MALIKISAIISTDNGGKLYLSQCPGKNLAKGRDGKVHTRDILEDVISFKSRGIDLIICLLNDYELRTIGVSSADYKSAISRAELDFIQYPIIEMSVPDSIESVDLMVLSPISQYISNGKGVLVHCRGGIGRAGTIGACMLKKLNLQESYSKAISYIRKKRDKRCIESRKQEDFVKSFFQNT